MRRRLIIGMLAALAAAGQSQLQYVVVTGQSLAMGTSSAPALTLTQPYGNLRTNSTYTSMYALTEDGGGVWRAVDSDD